MVEYKGFQITTTLPSRQHRNATALMQVRKDGISLKSIRYRVHYLPDEQDALKKAVSFIDKQLTDLALKTPYKVIRGQFEIIEGKLNVTCTTENVTFEEVRDVFYQVQKHFEHQIAFQRQCPHFGKEGVISEQTTHSKNS